MQSQALFSLEVEERQRVLFVLANQYQIHTSSLEWWTSVADVPKPKNIKGILCEELWCNHTIYLFTSVQS